MFLSGCATIYNPATGRNEFIFVDSGTETAIGRSALRELGRKRQLSPEPALKNRVNSVGKRLASVSDRKDISYSFGVLEDRELNALTLPGGFIFINRGLLEVLDDDELAYVLGHEIGHVAGRHIAKKIQANMAYELITGIAFAGSSDKAGPSTREVSGGIDILYDLIGLSYSRKDEFEADALGVRYSFRAGFNPYACLAALEKIRKSAGPDWKILGYFRTHPYVDERISALKSIIPLLENEKK